MSFGDPYADRGPTMMCSVHKRRRNVTDLVDLGGGHWRCAPGNECRELDLEMCSVHNRRRQRGDLTEVSPGVFQCTAAKPCRDFVPRGGFDGGRGGRGGGMYRGGGGDFEMRAPTSFAEAGQIRSREGGFAASAVMGRGAPQPHHHHHHHHHHHFHQPQMTSDQIIARFVANQQLQQLQMMAAAAAASTTSSSIIGNASTLVTSGAGGAAATHHANQVAAFLATAEVWCSRHGRRLQLRAARTLDAGMTFMCVDTTECLSAPLEEPRFLASKGCTDLWCSKHKRVRGSQWLVVDPVAGRGFVCKKPHVCRPVDGVAAGADELD